MRRVVVFDLDGTLVNGDTYRRFLLGFIVRQPKRLARTWSLPFALALYFSGVRDNSWLKTAFLTAVMGGVRRSELEEWSGSFVNDLIARGIRSRALARLRDHQAHGDYVILATASLDAYVEPLARRLGFDDVICSRVVWSEDGRLTGALADGNCYGRRKAECIARLLAASGRSEIDFAYSDHESDRPLLEWARSAIAVSPTRALARWAKRRAIPIEDWGAA
ncbi:MAG TPA: HAD family hydrolase [Alphaproteobacteria bacterium]|nr:HAD family hydrolase [Alphaproteobacteria bacterium]